MVHQAALPGTGFECLPALSISSVPFHFLKSLDLKSVGLGLQSVPFRFRWDLVEWNPKLVETRVDLGLKLDEFVDFVMKLRRTKLRCLGLKLKLT